MQAWAIHRGCKRAHIHHPISSHASRVRFFSTSRIGMARAWHTYGRVDIVSTQEDGGDGHAKEILFSMSTPSYVQIDFDKNSNSPPLVPCTSLGLVESSVAAVVAVIDVCFPCQTHYIRHLFNCEP